MVSPADHRADDQHEPPIERVGEHAAPEPGDDHRDQRDAADQRDGEGRRGDVVDLQADGDDRELRADPRDRRAEPEPGEGGRFAQRRDVDEAARRSPASVGVARSLRPRRSRAESAGSRRSA